jgi:2-succinyl-5-enolpyruvyl-6-hydroxy-3-cyclohexene-1-carboxylate synthase
LSDPQSQWALVLLESLVEAGVRSAVISPGSRSTPLVWAASRTNGLLCQSIIDERSAAFYALGQARVSGVPSLLVCTSGTALANYFPAVIEARESGLPLIVLSADRPFELSHCGAHQTIDQTRLFGAYAPYHELGTPVPDREALLGLRRTAWQAVAASLEAPRGAVHLNFRARKPLEPSDEPASVELPPPGRRAPIARTSRAVPSDVELETLLDLLAQSECPLLICGASSAHDGPEPELVQLYAELSGSIICPESVSQMRLRLPGGSGPGALVCDSYDWLLGSAELGAQLAPDFALQLGGTPVSANLERLISRREEPIAYAICAESGWPDPLHQSAALLRARPNDLLRAVCQALEGRPRAARPRAALWREAQASARAVIDRHTRGDFGEAAAVVATCAALPPGSLLAIANSLPPRLLDRYVAAAAHGVQVCCQRGASGIEGAIAGALGAASMTAQPVTLLVGDVSFLHDIGSLWAALPERTHAGRWAQPVVMVVLNNAGGRIFEQLPIASQPAVPLELWTTPHRIRLRPAAQLYGIPYAEVSDRAGLRQALATAYAGTGVTLIEVVVEPDNAARTQRAVAAELAPQLAALAARGRA